MARGRAGKNFASPLTEADEAAVAEVIGSCRWDPLKYTLAAYDWGEEGLETFQGPKAWQVEIMEEIRRHLENPTTRHIPLKIAVSSGKGIGKTALIAMITMWAMSTCVDTRMRITANTEDQLRGIVWPEIQKWHKMSINSHWFEPTATALISKLPGHEANWRANAVTWSESNLEAFAGFHNYGKRLVAIADEGSGIADGVFDNMEGFLTDADTEIIVITFGNPTRNYGRFYEIFHGKKETQEGWISRSIDSRTVEGVNLEQINKWEREYGSDSDFFKSTVRGLFPETSIEQFISGELLNDSLDRSVDKITQFKAPLIIGVDPAHSKDEIAITARQGYWLKVLEVFKKTSAENDEYTANKVAYWEDELRADAVFIDLGWGTGVKTVGDMLNRKWRLVAFGGKSPDPKYVNMRAYMAAQARQWMRDGGSLGGDEDLKKELSWFQGFLNKRSQTQLESKEDMEARLGKLYKSPGRADSTFLTFAHKVVKKSANQVDSPFENNKPVDFLHDVPDPRG